MPAPLGKFEIVLPLIVALVRLAAVAPLPVPISWMPPPFELAVLVELLIVLF